ncbi:spermatogenesis-associated protein 6 isoform X3 [Cryptotermes secundus]|uniref:spermatogenesis-associated protein 6 isoform X3 n=1 Tax=Cryptotermes secundus TaxID=105785 RepID=UPI001454D23A|nr:spermatogenesis-associated protein 6 isoform X3 [Cryptotermes secundus]
MSPIYHVFCYLLGTKYARTTHQGGEVTCPGVWLCPNGKIILKLFMFGSSARAPHLPPIFPLLYHQKFVFQKTFTNVRYLTDLQHLLGKEFVHAELIQSSGGSGAVLASFETTVLELLYPSPCVKGLIAGVDIDLLMEPRKCFPGILGPKIKVSTKTTIEEVLDTSPSNKRNPGLINHKLLSSKNSSTTKGCYQNKTYHDKHQPHRSPELRKKPESPCCKQNPSLSAVMPNTDGSSRCTCGHCQMDTTGNRVQKHFRIHLRSCPLRPHLLGEFTVHTHTITLSKRQHKKKKSIILNGGKQGKIFIMRLAMVVNVMIALVTGHVTVQYALNTGLTLTNTLVLTVLLLIPEKVIPY